MEDVIAEGDKVVRWMRRGTHTGDFVTPTMHLPATGKQVTVTGITIFRLLMRRSSKPGTSRIVWA